MTPPVRDWFSADSFLGGGVAINYWGVEVPDKLAHFLAGAFFSLWYGDLRFWPGDDSLFVGTAFQWVLVVAVAWEVLELLRYIAWRRRTKGQPFAAWPVVTDRFSWRDVVACAVGFWFVWGLGA